MPPLLALTLTLGFLGILFWRDVRARPDVSYAVWLPLIWLFLIATRPVSKWLSLFGFNAFLTTDVEEGNFLDAAIFCILIAMAIIVLGRRKVRLSALLGENPWLAVFVFYCLLAVFWSDLPTVSFKHWIKVLGHPVMAVLLFTEVNWQEATATVMKRCAYVFLPVSILWIKYFPALGRKSSEYGEMSNTGVCGTKNVFGATCWILAFFFLWHFLQVRRQDKSRSRRNEIILTLALFVMALYCLRKAHSAAAILALMLATTVMIGLGLRSLNKRAVGRYAVAIVTVLGVAQLTFDLYGKIVDLSGHESTIEGRGRLWQVLMETDTNRTFGTGFESYWIGPRMEKIWAMPEFWWHPNQAHNGYLELYLNLGGVGLCIFAAVVFVTFTKIRFELLSDFEWARFEMGVLFAILAHNWTEAGFKGLSITFFVFFIVSVKRTIAPQAGHDVYLPSSGMPKMAYANKEVDPERHDDFANVQNAH